MDRPNRLRIALGAGFVIIVSGLLALTKSAPVLDCSTAPSKTDCDPHIFLFPMSARKSWGEFDFSCRDGVAWRIYVGTSSAVARDPKRFVLQNLTMFGVSHSTPTIDDEHGFSVWTGKRCTILTVELKDDPPYERPEELRISEEEAIRIAKERAVWREHPSNSTARATEGFLSRSGRVPSRLYPYWLVILQKTNRPKPWIEMCIDAVTGTDCTADYKKNLSISLPP